MSCHRNLQETDCHHPSLGTHTHTRNCLGSSGHISQIHKNMIPPTGWSASPLGGKRVEMQYVFMLFEPSCPNDKLWPPLLVVRCVLRSDADHQDQGQERCARPTHKHDQGLIHSGNAFVCRDGMRTNPRAHPPNKHAVNQPLVMLFYNIFQNNLAVQLNEPSVTPICQMLIRPVIRFLIKLQRATQKY